MYSLWDKLEIDGYKANITPQRVDDANRRGLKRQLSFQTFRASLLSTITLNLDASFC